MQKHSYDLKGMLQSNAVLTSSKSAVVAQFSQMTVTMNTVKAQLKNFSLVTTNPTRTKRKFYCWICGKQFTNGGKTCTAKKSGHTDDAYY